MELEFWTYLKPSLQRQDEWSQTALDTLANVNNAIKNSFCVI